MAAPMINLENLGKKYTIRHEDAGAAYTTLAETLVSGTANTLRRLGGASRLANRKLAKEQFWAVRGVSMDVQQGEVVGIIGRNGAGKSTLLKLLSRITEPSEGRIVLNGRVASLLEVGTGFHPELTGRENVYLNGAILGMTRAEVTRKFDEIVDFADVEQFLDTPVKRYSSGMKVRLAFAVAAHLEPEILVVDEVLAVGDISFQKKCLSKMQDVAGSGGRTVLFVSHNMAAVSSLCPRCILLHRGQVVCDGETSSVIERYLAEGGQDAEYVRPAGKGDIDTIGFESARVVYETPVRAVLELSYRVAPDKLQAAIGVQVVNSGGAVVTTIIDMDTEPELFEKRAGLYQARCNLPTPHLVPGIYTVNLSAADMRSRRFEFLEGALTFEVTQGNDAKLSHLARRQGSLLFPAQWRVSGTAGTP